MLEISTKIPFESVLKWVTKTCWSLTFLEVAEQNTCLPWVLVTWVGKHHHSKHHPFLLLHLDLYAECHIVGSVPLVSQGQLPWLCLLSAASAPPASAQMGCCEKQKKPLGLCVRAAQKQLKHPCVISTISNTNPKYSSISAAIKKINSTPTRTSTNRKKDYSALSKKCLYLRCRFSLLCDTWAFIWSQLYIKSNFGLYLKKKNYSNLSLILLSWSCIF